MIFLVMTIFGLSLLVFQIRASALVRLRNRPSQSPRGPSIGDVQIGLTIVCGSIVEIADIDATEQFLKSDDARMADSYESEHCLSFPRYMGISCGPPTKEKSVFGSRKDTLQSCPRGQLPIGDRNAVHNFIYYSAEGELDFWRFQFWHIL
jgi:hypothetical protein